MNWFAGYQGDFVHIGRNAPSSYSEQVLISSLKLGINIPIGGKTSPFHTPNFREALVNTDLLN